MVTMRSVAMEEQAMEEQKDTVKYFFESTIKGFITQNYKDIQKESEDYEKIRALLSAIVQPIITEYGADTKISALKKKSEWGLGYVRKENVLRNHPIVALLKKEELLREGAEAVLKGAAAIPEPIHQYFSTVIYNTALEKEFYTDFTSFFEETIPQGITFSEIINFWSGDEISRYFHDFFLPLLLSESEILDNETISDTTKRHYIDLVGNLCSLLQSRILTWNRTLDEYKKQPKIIENMVIGALQSYVFARLTQKNTIQKIELESTLSAEPESTVATKKIVHTKVPDFFLESALRTLRSISRSSVVSRASYDRYKSYIKYLVTKYVTMSSLIDKDKKTMITTLQNEIDTMYQNAQSRWRGFRQNIAYYLKITDYVLIGGNILLFISAVKNPDRFREIITAPVRSFLR